MNIYISTLNINTTLNKFRQRELALYLLDYALEREFGVKRGEIVRNKHGKPYFKDSDIHFNYSHCKHGAACVVANQEVGVDIQEMRQVKPAVIKRVCCDNELKAIQNGTDFIKIWVKKEAYSKFTGKGFTEGFKHIDTTAFPDSLVLKHGNLYIACYSDSQPLTIIVNEIEFTE